jgi:hypothetical protein
MQIYKYTSYKEYLKCQKAATAIKGPSGKQWAIKDNIEFLAQYLTGSKFGICHGTRSGAEQQWFMDAIPGCEVWGTEISETSKNAKNTKITDFNSLVPAWVGKADFVYSNSFDHVYDPKKTLKLWFDQLNDTGSLVLEHSDNHESGEPTKTDPVKFSIEDIGRIKPKGSRIRSVLVAPKKKSIIHIEHEVYFIVIERE